TAADEPASLLRDDSQGETFPAVSGLEAGHDMENIIKTSALPHDLTPRVTSLDTDEGKLSRDDAPIKRRSLETGEEAGVEKCPERGIKELKMIIDGLDRSNEVIVRHLHEYEKSQAELTIGEKIELINELVKYQDHHAKIL
nr:hypothetical protein [Tanacetum cinerariifolium]